MYGGEIARTAVPTVTERVSDLMRPVYLVPDSRSVDELLRDMQAARTHLAVLVDEYGGTAGLVTIEDVRSEEHTSELQSH